ncbi:phosphonate ABC transporter ATP-binding protein [Methanocaldococcus sp.]
MNNSNSDFAIIVKNLKKSFNNNQVLKGISFKVKRGEVVGILGLSGAGKTTLLRCLIGLEKPDDGEIIVDGEKISPNNKKIRKKMGMVFQQFNLIPRTNVLTNVLMGRLPHINSRGLLYKIGTLIGYFPKKDIEIAINNIKKVGLEEKIYENISNLSGGQQQRVGIARVLSMEPIVILADEPVSSLDPKTSEEILNLFVNISKNENISVVINLHQLDYAKKYCDRIIGLANGRIVFDGTPEDLDKKTIGLIYGGKNENS